MGATLARPESRRLSAALRLVPGLESGAPPRALRRLHGGSVNATWRVDSGAGRFVLRIAAGDSLAPRVARRNERLLHEVAARAALAPTILAANARGDLVLDWVPGAAWRAADFARAERARVLGRLLGRLQDLSPPASVRKFRPLVVAEAYAERARAMHSSRAAIDRALRKVETAARALEAVPLPAVIVHGDLASGNLLGARAPQLIDWEYAQVAHPACEYGALLSLVPRCAPALPPLPSLASLPMAAQARALRAATRLYLGLNALWHAARPPGTGIHEQMTGAALAPRRGSRQTTPGTGSRCL